MRNILALIALCIVIVACLLGYRHMRHVKPSSTGPTSGLTTINVDLSARRHRISPLVYGVAFATKAQLADLHAPSNRCGGNSCTRYNWQQNCSNKAKDWYFESIQENSKVPGAFDDTFVGDTKAAKSQPILTVPTMGWVARVNPDGSKRSSYSVAKYGAQQFTDNWMPDAGNGTRPDGKLVTGNDPADADVRCTPAYERPWLDHLVQRWKPAKKGGIRYYLMDNEPGLWHDTHRDVHPAGATAAEVLGDIEAYALMVKSADPGALVGGPEEWSYLGATQSGYDLQFNDLHKKDWYVRLFGLKPDQKRCGGELYYPWLLKRLHANDLKTGKRLLDILTVHYYPQGGEFSDDVSDDMQLRRNRSTRSLWDPNYTDETWVNAKIRLIPLLHEWTARYYPGTKIGITEYNWGAEKHMNGATAQADVLGIFGREGLDMANRWATPDKDTPVYNVFKLYRNYDGHNGSFGDVSVAADAPNPDWLSAFASVRPADHAITIMVIDKSSTFSSQVMIALKHACPSGTAQVWQLAGENKITRLADSRLDGEHLHVLVPAQSVTLFVVAQTPPRAKH